MLTFHHSALFLRDIQFLLVTIHVKHSQGDERYIFWTDVFFKINNNHFFFKSNLYFKIGASTRRWTHFRISNKTLLICSVCHHSFMYSFNQQIFIHCLHQCARWHLTYDISHKSRRNFVRSRIIHLYLWSTIFQNWSPLNCKSFFFFFS